MAYRTRLRTDSVLEITVPPSSTPTIVRVAGSDRTTQTGLVVDAPAEVQLTVASRQQPRVIRSPARQRAAG